MQVYPGNADPCLLLLLLSSCLPPDRMFVSTWDLVDGFLHLLFSPVVVYAYEAQCFKGCRAVREYMRSYANAWADMAICHRTLKDAVAGFLCMQTICYILKDALKRVLYWIYMFRPRMLRIGGIWLHSMY